MSTTWFAEGHSVLRMQGDEKRLVAQVERAEDVAPIVAAADMLDALRGLIADHDAHAHGRPAPGHTERVKAARAAITKAEGDR